MRKAALATFVAAGWFTAMFTTGGCGMLPRGGSVAVARVSGTVTDAVTHAPLSGVAVHLGVDGITSDERGEFSLYMPVNSTERIVVETRGYQRFERVLQTGRLDVRLDIEMSPERR